MALAVEGDGRVSRRVLLEACPALPAEAITALHALGDDQGVEDVVAALLGADQACPDKHAHEVGATGNGVRSLWLCLRVRERGPDVRTWDGTSYPVQP